MLGDKYKIQVSFPGSGLTDTSPVNSTMEWTFEREEGQIFYRNKLSSPLIFKDDQGNNVADFTNLYTLERNRLSRCDKVDVIIFKKCLGGGDWTQHWNGYLSLIDGKWNVSTCEVEIVPRIQDQYGCLFENWEKDINILGIVHDRYSSRSTIGVIEYRTCYRETLTFRGVPAYVGNTGCIDLAEYQANKGWTLVYWLIQEGSFVETRWAREVYTGQQPGDDWFNDGGVWVRGVEVVEEKDAFQDEGPIYRRSWKIVQYTLTNGVKLNDVLPAMLQNIGTCNYTLVSNFFGINPDGTNPNNRAYSKAFDHARNLYIYHKQDVRRAKESVDQPSFRINNLSFKRMIDNLKALFNLAFVIDPDTNTFRLEHLSYFEDNRMLDLTQDKFLNDIKGKWKYSYNKEALPIRENFKFMEPTTNEFDGLSIQYDVVCSNENKATNEATITADYFVTAVDDVVEFPDKYSEEGMVLVERAEAGYIVTGFVLSVRAQRNGNLGWSSLQDYYYRSGRPQMQGRMNGQVVNFDSFKRTRKQETIQVQLCCTDFESFNPIDLVKTQLGWGEIATAKYTEPQEVLSLDLIHD